METDFFTHSYHKFPVAYFYCNQFVLTVNIYTDDMAELAVDPVIFESGTDDGDTRKRGNIATSQKNPGKCWDLLFRARDEIRTRDPRLGKAMLYH